MSDMQRPTLILIIKGSKILKKKKKENTTENIQEKCLLTFILQCSRSISMETPQLHAIACTVFKTLNDLS